MTGQGSISTRGRRRAFLALAPLLVLVALVLPAPAAAAVPMGFMPCPTVTGFYCGTVSVPVDRSGVIPELVGKTIALHVMWKPGTETDTDGALVALAGGPGQAATPFAADFALALAPALKTRDLVVFDQRGTGQSAFLNCPNSMSTATNLQQFVQMCANELGPARDFYTSKDSAEDIDSVRQAVGAEKVTIFGVSYGTYVAQLYSRLFPAQTAGLVLDSVVSATGVDPFERSNFAAISKVLAADCSRKLCSGITSNPFADLTKVVQRSKAARLKLHYVDSAGRVSSFTAGEADIFNFMVETFSLDAVARSRIPSALRSELSGDSYPLGRLLVPLGSSSSSTQLSTALYLATSCSDITYPWSPADSPAVREDKAVSALGAIPTSSFSPFSPSTSLSDSDIPLCVYWPTSAVDSSVVAPAPDVPVLLLDGMEDDLTPLADGAAVSTLYPHAVRVNIPFTGHSTITDIWPDADSCVEGALAHYFDHTPIPSCAFVTPFFRPVGIAPVSLADVKPARLAGIRGMTLAAVLGTLSDVTETGFSQEEATGLRGGVFSGSVLNLHLRKVVYVPGVTVSGIFNVVTGAASLTISGSGSQGTLSIRRGPHFTNVKGKLDKRSLRVRVRTSANDSKIATQLPRLIGMEMSSRALALGASARTALGLRFR